MDKENVITYYQNDLPNISFAAFEGMRKKKQFCDLTITVQDQSFTAHRIIIAAVIPYFQSLFASNGAEIEEKEIAVENLDPTALEFLIDFAYTSKVNISSENAQSILVASQFLQLNKVCDVCVQFLAERFNKTNIIQIRDLACTINNSSLIENCDAWIRDNFEEFSKCPNFLNLPHSCVKAVISEDDLKVHREEVVFDAVISWVKNSPADRQVVLPELLSEVRLIFLPYEYLMHNIYSDTLIRNSTTCRDLLNEVKDYHLLPKLKSLFSNLQTQPRNYWNALYAVGSCLSCGLSVHFFDLLKGKWLPFATNKAKNQAIQSVFCVNEEICFFGQDTLLIFSLKSGEWEVLEQEHCEIEGGAIVPHEDRIYCFGSKNSEEVRYFDLKEKQWFWKGSMITVRTYSAAIVSRECVYVTGGTVDTTSNHGDTDKNRSQFSTCPTGFASAATATSLTSTAFSFSGGFGSTTLSVPVQANTNFGLTSKSSEYKCSNVVEKYVPSTGEWSKVASMLIARYKHGCTAMDSKIYVCGGLNSAGVALNTAEVYDPDADKWTLISPMKNARSSFSLVAYCNKIYAFGESGSEIYDPKTDEWKRSSSDVPGGFIGALSTAIFNSRQIGTL